MTKDDVMQVLRLIAMGRVGHPLQEEFAEKLAKVLAEPEALPPVGAPRLDTAPKKQRVTAKGE